MLLFGAVVLVALLIGAIGFTLWAVRWGATDEECSMPMAGDSYLDGGPPTKVVMTRAVTIAAPPETLWPWLAQLGRGAGWYSYDFLDNGFKTSARHIVTWVPPPRKGDATAIGYLRHIEPGSGLTWWTPGTRFLGSQTRLVFDIGLRSDEERSRLVMRASADATGGLPWLTLAVFRFMDSIMMRRQLINLRERVERHGARTANPEDPETGTRDQYQFYEVIYASGDRAGTRGKESAETWRRVAVEAGLTPAKE